MINKSKKPKSFFIMTFSVIIVLIAAICAIFIVFLYRGGVISELYKNIGQIFTEKVDNRGNYLENSMVSCGQKLKSTAEAINGRANRFVKQKKLNIKDFDSNSAKSINFISDISDDIIELIRSAKTTGAYIVLNCEKIDNTRGSEKAYKKAGLYIRDLDPDSAYSSSNADLLLERASSKLINNLKIPTDSFWNPTFEFQGPVNGYNEYFLKSFQNASVYRDSGESTGMSLDNSIYWSRPYTLENDKRKAISCSVPLFLSDGTVYGVVGIELLESEILNMLPYSELINDRLGTYVLGVMDGSDNYYKNLVVNGAAYEMLDSGEIQTTEQSDGNSYFYPEEDKKYFCSVSRLNLYDTNTKFSSQKWALIGTVNTNDLFASPKRVTNLLLVIVLITLILGTLGCIAVSFVISKPIEKLSKSVSSASRNENLMLSKSGVIEVDKLAAAVEKLSRDVMETGTKFVQILKMASIRISGFEINYLSGSLFIMEDFFETFNLHGINTRNMTVDEFEKRLKSLKKYAIDSHASGGYAETLYKIPEESGGYRIIKYISKYVKNEKRTGLAEDVTNTFLEKKALKNERDHDSLTGIINRRAFYQKLSDLFENKQYKLKTAAVIMLDLDGLKNVNDRYGHNCGDKLIKVCADCFIENSPKNSIVARISGDEFYVVYYGYENKCEAAKDIIKLKESLNATYIYLPDGVKMPVSVSGGISWFPDDSRNYLHLLKYSDFAMYKSKQTGKGSLSAFDRQLYIQENNRLKKKADFYKLIDNELVEYAFQPIVDVKSGRIFAYEALMRGQVESLRSPDKILELALEEKQLDRIEELTMLKSLEAADRGIANGYIDKGMKIFINSITNQALKADAIELIEKQYPDHLSNIVLEIIEIDKIGNVFKDKKETLKSWQAGLALDDFGTGYNNDFTLLQIAPDYVKIDMSIIRGINSDADKRKIVENLESYAKERKIKLIAEGIETWEEAQTVIELGVDYLQGFYIAKPEIVPPKVNEQALNKLQAYNSER